MKIPSRWFDFVKVCKLGVPAPPPIQMRAEKLITEHDASHALKLARTLPRRKAEASAHRAKTGATKAVREVVAARTPGRCEACGADGLKREMDHFFGKARSETVETCWMLCAPTPFSGCHFDKTNSKWGRRYWLLRFRRHAALHGYGRAIAMVDQQLALEQAQHPTPERSPK